MHINFWYVMVDELSLKNFVSLRTISVLLEMLYSVHHFFSWSTVLIFTQNLAKKDGQSLSPDGSVKSFGPSKDSSLYAYVSGSWSYNKSCTSYLPKKNSRTHEPNDITDNEYNSFDWKFDNGHFLIKLI